MQKLFASYILPLSMNEMTGHRSPSRPHRHDPPRTVEARFGIGDVVRHRLFPFRGVVFDVDPEFANSEEWWQAIPEDLRPAKDQPFYHLLADGEDSSYVAYVSQQNLVADRSAGPVLHPAALQIFDRFRSGRYVLRPGSVN